MRTVQRLGLREAQKEIATDWVASYRKYICDAGIKLTALAKVACAS